MFNLASFLTAVAIAHHLRKDTLAHVQRQSHLPNNRHALIFNIEIIFLL